MSSGAASVLEAISSCLAAGRPRIFPPRSTCDGAESCENPRAYVWGGRLMMTRRIPALAFGTLMVTLATTAALRAAGAQGASPAAQPLTASARATLDKYCVGCHNERLRTGSLT